MVPDISLTIIELIRLMALIQDILLIQLLGVPERHHGLQRVHLVSILDHLLLKCALWPSYNGHPMGLPQVLQSFGCLLPLSSLVATAAFPAAATGTLSVLALAPGVLLS